MTPARGTTGTAAARRSGARVTPAALRKVSRVERQRQIMALVRSRAIPSQEALVDLLRERGLDVTQATVSRDLRDLGVLRVRDGRGMRYAAAVAEIDETSAATRLSNAFREYVKYLEFVDYLGVIHTSPGSASLVASAIDGMRFDEVAGTIAGDDTVVVIARNRPAAQRLARTLESAGA